MFTEKLMVFGLPSAYMVVLDLFGLSYRISSGWSFLQFQSIWEKKNFPPNEKDRVKIVSNLIAGIFTETGVMENAA